MKYFHSADKKKFYMRGLSEFWSTTFLIMYEMNA